MTGGILVTKSNKRGRNSFASASSSHKIFQELKVPDFFQFFPEKNHSAIAHVHHSSAGPT